MVIIRITMQSFTIHNLTFCVFLFQLESHGSLRLSRGRVTNTITIENQYVNVMIRFIQRTMSIRMNWWRIWTMKFIMEMEILKHTDVHANLTTIIILTQTVFQEVS